MTIWRHRGNMCALFFLALLAGPPLLDAALILNMNPATVTASAGATAVFSGTVTNTTGSSLNLSDIFVNVVGYDPSVISSISQLLGDPDMVLPNNTFSPLVGILSVSIAPSAPPGLYFLEVTLQDFNDNISDSVTASAEVTAIPEPSSWLLSLVGLVCLVVGRVTGHNRSRA